MNLQLIELQTHYNSTPTIVVITSVNNLQRCYFVVILLFSRCYFIVISLLFLPFLKQKYYSGRPIFRPESNALISSIIC